MLISMKITALIIYDFFRYKVTYIYYRRLPPRKNFFLPVANELLIEMFIVC